MKIRLGSGLLPVNLVTLAAIIATISFPQDFFRVLFGVPFLLFCPGYALLAFLFPRKEDIDGIERTTLIFILSIVIVPLIGIIVNYTPWGITLGSTVFSVALFVFSTSILALRRMSKLSAHECLAIEFNLTMPIHRNSSLERIFIIASVIVVLVALGTLVYVVTASKSGDLFTEFYILGPEGDQSNYPDILSVGEEGNVTIGIVNHENKETVYQLQIIANGTRAAEIGPVLLANEERWEDQARWVAEIAGEDIKVEFLLYKDNEVDPYLDSVKLWIDVFDDGDLPDHGDITPLPIGSFTINHEDVVSLFPSGNLDLSRIPEYWIDQAKNDLHIAYFHTSHGNQIYEGMRGLVGFANDLDADVGLPAELFAFNEGGNNGTLDFHNVYGTHAGRETEEWTGIIADYLNSHPEINVVMISFDHQLQTYETITLNDRYFSPMEQMESTYPNVTFIYFTGALKKFDDPELYSIMKERNQEIRDYAISNGKILYDWADVESYDPDGTYYEFINDNCDYYSSAKSTTPEGNWALQWQETHTEGVDWYDARNESTHTVDLNVNQKAYAVWQMFARLVGWDGGT